MSGNGTRIICTSDNATSKRFEIHCRKKYINEVMEAELTESSEMDSKTDNLAVTEEANIDEAIPIYVAK